MGWMEPFLTKISSMKNKPPFHASILAFAIIALLAANSHAVRQPNIIYINTDDWGIGKVPCYKMDSASERIFKTPTNNGVRKPRKKK